MYRLCGAAVLGCLLLAARPALAQEGSKTNVQKLEADVAKLRVLVNDLESRLQKVKEATAKQGEKTPAAHWTHHGFGWLHFARMHDKMASCQKMHTQAKDKAAMEEKATQSPWTGWMRHGGHWSHGMGHGGWAGHHHYATHHHGWHEFEHSSSASIEQRLDRITRELAALRQELLKTK